MSESRGKRTAREWLDEINAGLSFRRVHGLEASWAGLEAKFFSVSPSTDTGANIVASKGDSLVSALAVPEVFVMVTPQSQRAFTSAPVVESLDNQLVNALEVEEAMEAALTSAFLFGVGFVKVGYDSEYGYDPELRLGPLGATMSQFGSKGQMLESGRAKSGMPFCVPVLPHDVVVPWGTRTLADTPWVAHRVIRRVDDVKEDAKYVNTRGLRGNLNAEQITKMYGQVKDHVEDSTAQPSSAEPQEPVFIELWEIMDKSTRRVLVLALHTEVSTTVGGETESRSSPRLIREDKNELQVDNKLPWVEVVLSLRSRAFWVTPIAYYMRPHQDESDDIALQAKKQRRASIMKLLARKGAVSDEQKENLLSAEPAVLVEVEDRDGPLSDTIAVIGSNSTINTLLHLEAQAIESAARETIGMSRMDTGEFDSKNRRTAYEVSQVQQGGDARLGRKQKSLRRAYGDLIAILNALLATHWTGERFVQVTGLEGVRWEKVSAEILRSGPYAYQISFSHEHFPSMAQRTGQALQLMAAFAGNPMVDQALLAAHVAQAFNLPGFKVNAGAGGAGGAPGGQGAGVRVPMSGVPGQGG